MSVITMNALRGEKPFKPSLKDNQLLAGMEKIQAFIARGIAIQKAKIEQSRAPKKKRRGRPRKTVAAQ